MKKRFFALIIGAVLLIPTANAFAESGSVTMTRNGITPMVVESAGGGTWDHGFSSSSPYEHWSNYDHTEKTHMSSAGNFHSTVSSEWNSATEGWTYARCADTLWGNTANWNTK